MTRLSLGTIVILIVAGFLVALVLLKFIQKLQTHSPCNFQALYGHVRFGTQRSNDGISVTCVEMKWFFKKNS